MHYIAKGMLDSSKYMVKYHLVRGFLRDVDGVICPSEIVRWDLYLNTVKVKKNVSFQLN